MTDVLARIVALKTTPIPALKKLWRDLYDSDPPAYNRRLLESRLAYRLQELAHGGLKTSTVRHLEKLGEQLDGGNARIRSRRVDDRPVAGTRLIRTWQGVDHEVTVQPDHFLYAGKPYKSLSAIARAITNVSWNGPVFFGLRTARRSP